MARLMENSLNYTMFNNDFYEDPKLRVSEGYLLEHGLSQIQLSFLPITVSKLLMHISSIGYLAYADKELTEVLYNTSKSYGITLEIVELIIKSLLFSDFISREMYDNYRVITSQTIQDRWLMSINWMRRASSIEKRFNISVYKTKTYKKDNPNIASKQPSKITYEGSFTERSVTNELVEDIYNDHAYNNPVKSESSTSFDSNEEIPIKECMEIYLTSKKFSKHRDDVSVVFRFPPSLPLLRNWCQAFVDYQILILKTKKSPTDFGLHFFRWLNMTDTSKDPAEINSLNNIKNKQVNGQSGFGQRSF